MTQLLMAAALFLLALARIPALIKNGRDTVFLAAAYACASSTLTNPDVYVFVDPLLGGINLTKLALNSLMMIGLWYLRTAIVDAVAPEPSRRAPWVRRLPLIVMLALQALFFILTGPTTTTTSWGVDYHYLVPGACFSLMLIAFIAWSCGEIAWACFKFVPRMRRSFRVGFSMVGLGCIISVIAITKMGMDVLASAFPALKPLGGAAGTPFAVLEMIAIVLVGVGLTIPAVAGRVARAKTARWEQLILATVEPIRERVLMNASMDRTLEVDATALPQERLHRMIVEIWDAELAAGQDHALTADERDYLLTVESKLDLERKS